MANGTEGNIPAFPATYLMVTNAPRMHRIHQSTPNSQSKNSTKLIHVDKNQQTTCYSEQTRLPASHRVLFGLPSNSPTPPRTSEPQRLGALHRAGQAAAADLAQVHRLEVRAQHVPEENTQERAE